MTFPAGWNPTFPMRRLSYEPVFALSIQNVTNAPLHVVEIYHADVKGKIAMKKEGDSLDS